MPPKRKSDAAAVGQDENDASLVAPIAKKLRKNSRKAEIPAPATEGSTSTRPKSWNEVKLDGEDELQGCIPVYDDCNDIRRKINVLRKQPNFVTSHWLKEIGNINSNSFNRFMSSKGKDGGAGNGTYYAAYVYFEKVRVLEGKKKTAGRQRNEMEHPDGFSTETPRAKVWIVPANWR